jgi:hypothetical protein
MGLDSFYLPDFLTATQRIALLADPETDNLITRTSWEGNLVQV